MFTKLFVLIGTVVLSVAIGALAVVKCILNPSTVGEQIKMVRRVVRSFRFRFYCKVADHFLGMDACDVVKEEIKRPHITSAQRARRVAASK
jgi:nicotinamide mononucleotide adenylyltransferase